MTNQPLPEIIFFRTESNTQKLNWICSQAEKAFAEQKNLLILVASLEVAQYIDQLLWKHPPDSFLPHVITDQMTTSPIAITIQNQVNINKASIILNLSPDTVSSFPQVSFVYELFDASSLEKAAASEKKIEEYKKLGQSVELAFC